MEMGGYDMDIKDTGDKLVEGAKKIPSSTTGWMVLGAIGGMFVGVMLMSAMFGNRPSLTPYVYPGAPVPPQGGS